MRKTFLAVVAAVVCLTGRANDNGGIPNTFGRPTLDSLKALKATVGKPFSAGYVFVDGHYLNPPYTVQRYGTVIRINGVQVTGEIVPWSEFVMTQSGAKATKSESTPASEPASEPVAGPEAPAEEPEEIGDDESSLDDLFADEPVEKKKKPLAKKRPVRRPKPQQPVVTPNYSFEGEFKHKDGHIMRGTFKNNYMLDKEKNIYLNPFLCADDSDAFREENIKYAEFLSKTKKKFTRENVKVVYNNDEIISYMADCFNNNMTPLLIRTVERMVGKEELLSYLPSEYVEIDLKYYYLKLREFHLDSKEVKSIYEEIQGKFVDAMTNGKYLVLNYDDCAVQYDELFEPDLKEISGNLMFSPFLFTPQTFAEESVFVSYAKGRKDVMLNPDFKFVVYSRYLITDVNATQEELKDIIERKFKKSFPLKFMDVFVLSKPKVEEQPQQEVNDEEDKKENETAGAKMLSSQSKKK